MRKTRGSWTELRRYHHFQSVHTSLIFSLTAWHGLEKGDTRMKETLAALPTVAPSCLFSKLEIGSKLRLRANGRNIVDQQLPTLLDVTCCVRLHTLLHVAGCCCVLLRKV